MSENEIKKDPKEMTIKELEDLLRIKKTNIIKNNESNENDVQIKNALNSSSISINKNIINSSSYPVLNYNYFNNLEKKKSESKQIDEPQKFISQLQNENNELRYDIKKLFYLTDQNKSELQKTISKFQEENFAIKKENFELKNKIILQENIIKNLEADKVEIIKEKNIMTKKYENEICILDCELNNYKSKLNEINYQYQFIFDNYHSLKEKIILEQTSKECINENINEIKNLNEIILKQESTINDLKCKLTNYEVNTKKKPFAKAISKKNIKSSITNNLSKNLKNNSNPISINFKTIDDEINQLEKKMIEIKVSYQNFLSELNLLPNNNYKQSQDLKNTLQLLESNLNEKQKKINELKEKKQKLLFNKKIN